MMSRLKKREDLSFTIFNYSVLSIFLVLILYPIYYMFIASISDPNAANQGLVIYKPVGITIAGYKKILSNDNIWIGYRNSLFYATVGTCINLLFMIPAAYALSRKELPGRNLFMYMITFTMFFSGGMVPTYFVVKNLKMLDTPWALLLPGAIVAYYLIIARSFFQSTIPEELLEASFIDGASYFTFFFKVVLPLSKPIIAVMVLFHAVGHWNAYFQALLYITKEKLYPLQLVLRAILVESEAAAMTDDVTAMAEKQKLVDLIKYGVVIVASVPVMILYPFVQKYFVQGVMIGAVKG